MGRPVAVTLALIFSFLLAAVASTAQAASATLAAFSNATPGARLPAPWRIETLDKLPRHTRYELVTLDGATVLRVTADNSYANLLHPLAGASARSLRWRWRVEQALEKSDLTRKEGDDVPARVCVLFDVPLERLRFFDRLGVEFGRTLFQPDLPAASICYVWDRLLAPGTWLANAYTDRVQMLVLRQGKYGQWFDEVRDLGADFQRAFPQEARGGTPPIAAIGLSADADNTAGRSLAYFGDITLEGR